MAKDSSTVRIDAKNKRLLKKLSEQEGRPQLKVLADALEQYRRNKIFEAANTAYAELKHDEKAWKEELEEREAWDGTLADGLEEY